MLQVPLHGLPSDPAFLCQSSFHIRSPRSRTDSSVTFTSRPDWNRAITPKKFPKAAFLTSFWKEKKRKIGKNLLSWEARAHRQLHNQWSKMAGKSSLEHPTMGREHTEKQPPTQCLRTVLQYLLLTLTNVSKNRARWQCHQLPISRNICYFIIVTCFNMNPKTTLYTKTSKNREQLK